MLDDPTVFGIGYIGVGPYTARRHGKLTPERTAWQSMLQRAYSPAWASKYPTYAKVHVCSEWHCFQTFAEWWHNTPNSGVAGFQLDKDLRVLGSQIYSPNTCSYVPQAVNKLLTDHGNARGDYPLGVGFLRGRFQARLNVRGYRRHLGVFDTIQDAYRAYVNAKEALVLEVAGEHRHQLHPEVFDTLMRWEVLGYE